ncbi:MAG: serine/threonine protein kinase [Polyangiaceae bacterium]|nr:serine/threonine protein kinase [Polyangiaceae bacterium]
MELRAGDRIDRYTLVRPLGKGGQGSVWQVVDPLDEGSLRALKIVQLADAGQAAFVRARREAKILAHLTHPSLCACYGLFEDLDRGLVGVVLDLVQGRPLDDLVHEGRLDQAQRMAILRQVAEVLAHVHAAGLAHRDLKPGNILVTDGFWSRPDLPGTVKLVDFGIAVPLGNPQKLTSVGGVIGTIPYLSPELFDPRGRASSEESCARDVFAFGVIAYELHFGGHPTGLGHSASFEVVAQRYRELLSGARAWPPRSMPGAWGLAMNACLALRPEDRPRNGGELLEILRTGRMPARPVISRTETHTPAPGSLSPSSPRVGRSMTPATEPMTAPMPMVSPGPPPPPVHERPVAKSIHGPLYALALAIVALAAVIYFKDAGKSTDAESPLIPLPQATSVAQSPEPPAPATKPGYERATSRPEAGGMLRRSGMQGAAEKY